jgi:hypothetical protein
MTTEIRDMPKLESPFIRKMIGGTCSTGIRGRDTGSKSEKGTGWTWMEEHRR